MNVTAVDQTRARPVIAAYAVTAVVVLALMMVLGLVMRLAQGGLVELGPMRFYQVLSAHGIGMVGIAGLAGAAILWHFLRPHVALSRGVLVANLVLFLIGVVLILGGIFVGGYAGLWTFLYPLPAHSAGVWPPGAAASYLAGVLVVGVGFLLLFLDIGRALIARYGGLGRSLGLPQLLGRGGEPPPAPVVAATMVTIINVPAIAAGAAVLVVSLVNVYRPELGFDALLAKNLIYFFGHVFINSTIYMAIVAVYEILPRYTGRPWRVSRPFLAGWAAATVMVLIVYPHHLLMDFVMPDWMLVMGQVISYTSGIPVLAVTLVGTLAQVYRSGIRWTLAPALLVLSVFGWSAGVLPAIVDATIPVNLVMHNTMWVPGHFHFYLLLGMVAMFFGFVWHLLEEAGATAGWWDRLGLWLYAGGGLAFVAMFLASGVRGIPRRWAVHLPEWVAWDRLASLFAAAVVVAVLMLLVRLVARLRAVAATA